MRLSDGMGTYIVLTQESNFLHIEARANLTTLGLTYVVMLAFILYRLRRNHERGTKAS